MSELALYIGKSPINGEGLFTAKDIPWRTVLINLLDNQDWYLVPLGRVPEEKIERDAYIWRPGTNYVLTSNKRSLFGYVNHSVKANCYVNFDKMTLVTQRNVLAGDELTVDYRDIRPSRFLHGREWLK